MSKPGAIIAPQGRNLADMLEILADPVQYRKHLDELKAKHKEIDDRLGLYNQLDKIQAYHKQVKDEAAAVSKSKADADALWAKLEQSSKDLAASKHTFAANQAALEQEHTDKLSAHARDLSAHLANVQAYEQAVADLAQDRLKLQANVAKHDARLSKAKDKLAAVVDAVKGVEAL